jgi:hypothetical protein
MPILDEESSDEADQHKIKKVDNYRKQICSKNFPLVDSQRFFAAQVDRACRPPVHAATSLPRDMRPGRGGLIGELSESDGGRQPAFLNRHYDGFHDRVCEGLGKGRSRLGGQQAIEALLMTWRHRTRRVCPNTEAAHARFGFRYDLWINCPQPPRIGKCRPEPRIGSINYIGKLPRGAFGQPRILSHAEYATVEEVGGTIEVCLRRVSLDRNRLLAAQMPATPWTPPDRTPCEGHARTRESPAPARCRQMALQAS